MQVANFPDLGPDRIQKPVFEDDPPRLGIKLRLLGVRVPFDLVKPQQRPEKIIHRLKARIVFGRLLSD